MTIIRKFNAFYRKKIGLGALDKIKKVKISNFNLIIFFTSAVLLSITFFSINSIVNQQNLENQKNMKAITSSKDFLNFRKT